MACLSMESVGLVPKGTGTEFAADGNLGLGGAVPIATFGGVATEDKKEKNIVLDLISRISQH